MYDQIIQSCQFLLNNYPDASIIKDYLDSRLNTESQDLFQFGYFPPLSNLISLTSIIGEEILTSSDLLKISQIEDSYGPRKNIYSYLDNHNLIMPFKDPYGDIVAIVGRSLLSDEERKQSKIAKYKNTVFKKGNYLFGLFENKENIIKQDLVYVVEGQFDVIKARQIGFNNVVALGSSHMTMNQIALILRYTSNIILLLDNDEAGEKGRKSILSKYEDIANIQNFYVPKPYKDIDDYITNEKINSFEDINFNV